MTINDMLEFCAEKGIMAVDITGYYFAGYPKVPSDEVLYKVKRKAFSLGLEIGGTGVRNDFTLADESKRQENVQLVKNWIEVAQKLGAQTLRIFSGNQKPEGFSRAQVLEWMLKDIRECVEYGKAHGVVVALQNHDDFIKTAADTIEIMEAIKSEWYGLMLDVGSFRTADPYNEIARTIKYAVTWQIKEKVFVRGKEVEVDADKLMKLIKSSGFRGYLPLETLGEGDPKQKVSALLEKFRRAMSNS
jgi:sugar phosphate isomerase/epimerase